MANAMSIQVATVAKTAAMEAKSNKPKCIFCDNPKRPRSATCAKHGRRLNADRGKSREWIIGRIKAAQELNDCRSLLTSTETKHIMQLPSKVREQATRKEFEVRGFVRVTGCLFLDVRKREH